MVREDTGPVYLGCLRENPAGSKATSPQWRIALARTPRGPGKGQAFCASTLETRRFGISGTRDAASDVTDYGHAYGQKGKGQANIASKNVCLGADGRVKHQFLSMSEGCRWELPLEVSPGLVISVRNLVRFVMWLGR